MKNLIILALILGLGVALFLTRPQKADFEKFARENKLTDQNTAGGPSITETINKQLQTFASQNGFSIGESPTDQFLKKCTYNNYLIFTNVEENGQLIYTGAVGHWFHRSPSVAPATSKG